MERVTIQNVGFIVLKSTNETNETNDTWSSSSSRFGSIKQIYNPAILVSNYFLLQWKKLDL